MSATRFLTGITTSGTPHLGNYVGAIRPTVQASLRTDVESFLFLADYHSLIKVEDPARIQRSTLEIAASWLACGLEPERVTFYRQSDIPEIPELTWFLTCVTGKGILNRAHAYKAAVDKNAAAGADTDADITAGLFMYPVLMGADILMFNAHKVPVGRDQVQHLEMARDMANSFNHRYGVHFVSPEAVIDESVAMLPGVDGRKMSKSYDNHIPLFAPARQLKKLIGGIVTDSRAPGEPKQVAGSSLFQIFEAFANESETDALRQAYANGISWADAKQTVYERLEQELAPMRVRYDALMREPGKIEDILLAGAIKARKLSTPFMARLRHAVGLRNLRSEAGSNAVKAPRPALPSFKQYRETDGRFYFKLVDAQGRLLVQSDGFTSPRDAGLAIGRLQKEGAAALPDMTSLVAETQGVAAADVEYALQLLADATKTAAE